MRCAVLSLLVLGLVAGLAAQQPPTATISRYDRGASLTMLKQVKIDLKKTIYRRIGVQEKHLTVS